MEVIHVMESPSPTCPPDFLYIFKAFSSTVIFRIVKTSNKMPLNLSCKISSEQFVVSDEELALRQSIGVPVPTLSPDERARRILARRNERFLYKRKCSGTGQAIISIHDSEVPFPVYDQAFWWSDKWDPYAYGREYDFSKSFFQQFAELYATVPQLSLNAPNCENSEWNNQSCDLKNCYMLFCSGFAEDCLYGMWNSKSQNCLDATGAFECRWCYQIFNCNRCFQCRHSDNLEQCSDCAFSRDLISCNDCIGCVGLQHKRYYYFNQALSKEEFENIRNSLNLGSRSAVAALESRFNEFQARFPRRYYNGLMAEDSSGDYLIRTQNVHNCYNFRESKDLWNCRDGWKCHKSLGLLECYTQDHCIEIEGSVGGTDCGFCNKIHESGNVWYSSHVFYSKDIFGCVGLRNAEHCIFNKRYSKSQFLELRKKIILQMKETAEWGENFPIKDSPFAYNLSMGQEYFPLTREQALKRGYRWQEDKVQEMPSVSGWNVPDNVADVSEAEALSQVIQCQESGRFFKYQKAEIEFYKNQNIPLPVVHHDLRFTRRMNTKRNPRKLYKGSCYYCRTDFLTTYVPASPYKIACEKCYSEYRANSES